MKELTDEMLKEYDKKGLKNLRENINNYIVNPDFNKIEWRVLNANEMEDFFYNNYYMNEEFVSWFDLGENAPLGMCYLFFPPYDDGFKFFIGSIKNNINKETIVGCIIYKDNWQFNNENELFTLIETVEINYFYQGLGLLNIMFHNFGKKINKKQNVIMTNESYMGSICKVMNHLKNNLNILNFQKKICFEHEIEDSYNKKKYKSR